MPWGEVVRTDFTIQKALWTHTKKQKISNFFLPQMACKIWALSYLAQWQRRSEPFLYFYLAARGGEDLEKTHPTLNPHNSGTPWANPKILMAAHKSSKYRKIDQRIIHLALVFWNCAKFSVLGSHTPPLESRWWNLAQKSQLPCQILPHGCNIPSCKVKNLKTVLWVTQILLCALYTLLVTRQEALQMQRDYTIYTTCFVTRNKKVTFKLTQGHWYSSHSIGRTSFPISLPL